MCTAVVYQTSARYFGRNLDLSASLGERVVITPRRFPLPHRRLPVLRTHFAMIGAALVSRGYPLYFDAVNERGLAMAGLNFPGSAVYRPQAPGADNVTPFELIPWLLGRCASLEEARALLERINLLDLSFSPELPLAPLHWLLSGPEGALVLEPGPEGLRVYENPIGVLTNNPPFPFHRDHLAHFLHLTREAPENRFAPTLSLAAPSLGLGAAGLPGDFSSASRFIRAAFVRWSSPVLEGEAESVRQMLQILGAAAMPPGCVRSPDGGWEHTVYTACCSADRGLYYYTTHENPALTCVDLRREDLDGTELVSYPFLREPRILPQNAGGKIGASS